jgi:hypothetical protein
MQAYITLTKGIHILFRQFFGGKWPLLFIGENMEEKEKLLSLLLSLPLTTANVTVNSYQRLPLAEDGV